MRLDDLPEHLHDRISIDPSTQCWLWQGMTTDKGYALAKVEGRRRRLHQISFEKEYGRPVAQGLVPDHTCNRKNCINGAHLEEVSHRENILRSPYTIAGRNSRKTHCLRGHEFSPENTYVDRRGRRNCRECSRMRKVKK